MEGKNVLTVSVSLRKYIFKNKLKLNESMLMSKDYKALMFYKIFMIL